MVDSADLLKWFETLGSRTLDLVGDYAGDERFLLEGDSLLLQCFSDNALDLSTGLQLLHATSLVEKFLANLRQRKCVFHVVFFAEHAQACVPVGVSQELRPKYRLAREAIVQHLVQNLETSLQAIEIQCFPSYHSREFQEYLHAVAPYFLMCHDGSAPVGLSQVPGANTSDSDESESDGTDSRATDLNIGEAVPEFSPTKIIMRSMIHWFVCNGYNISLLNSLECRDTKVVSMILEGSASKAQNLKLRAIGDLLNNADEDSESDSLESDHEEDYSSLGLSATTRKAQQSFLAEEDLISRISELARNRGMELTQREWATLIALGSMSRVLPFRHNDIVGARAMLMHIAILGDCKLLERAVVVPRCQASEAFMRTYVEALYEILTSEFWQNMIARVPCKCDLGDAIDGRLFLATAKALQPHNAQAFGSSTLEKVETLATALVRLFNLDVRPIAAHSPKWCDTTECNGLASSTEQPRKSGQTEEALTVLPFHNPVIDAHLEPVRVVVSGKASPSPSGSMSRIFQELSHWHNHKRPLDNRRKITLTERQQMFAHRRNQRFMTDTARYAASLTNAVGGSLTPETVFVKSQSEKAMKQPRAPHAGGTPYSSTARKENTSTKHKKTGKGTVSVRDQIAAERQSKQLEEFNKHFANWRTSIEGLERVPDNIARYVKVKAHLKAHLTNLPADKASALRPEILAYMLSILVNAWKEKCDTSERQHSVHILALIWQVIQDIGHLKKGVTEDIAREVQRTVRAIRLPPIEMRIEGTRKLPFEFAELSTRNDAFALRSTPTKLQLLHAGPYMDRSMGSAPDLRVRAFEPDKWQREVLDQIDARKSLFVVAPTSAGKTFISFYAIKQVLEDDNDGVLVYVAPTKALVNQIAAEVQARFSKSYGNTPGKSVWAIHTRDYRINNPTGCQVLITVPHILQIMLLAPSNARSWSPRVKRIIFDEVHCIGQAEDGLIWEQLLLLAPCPIIALSATIGNPAKFKEWLEITQKANGLELKMIEHKARYSDLRKYIYHPPKNFVFSGLPTPPLLPPLGLDESASMAFVHPVASLIDRSRGLPDDLTLEPRDCYTLWKSMTKHATSAFPVDASLDPHNALPSIIKKADVIEWESLLKQVLRNWMNDSNSPFQKVVKDLSKSISNHKAVDLQVSSGEFDGAPEPKSVEQGDLFGTTLPLICALHEQGALPALFFNYDRSKCEKICFHLLGQLEDAEKRWKASDTVWKKKLQKFKEWKKLQEKQTRVREPKKQKGKKRRDGDDDDGEEERTSRTEQARLVASKESSMFETFNPNNPVAGFHFADEKKLTDSEFDEYATQLRHRNVPEQMVTALRRGIGIHHSGLNRKYRQVCEILFRKGYLRIVIATGTLALGINMPCKTVVFSGDSVYLTALGFRQAAGRAGRRGFDFLGNVVFQGISQAKVCRLLSSKLPDLNGHFPLTTSLVLRLMTLLHESKGSPYAVKAINSILSCPRIYLGGDEPKHTVLHHLRFSIEYLRRNWLLSERGAPLNFSGTISHLYYTGNSGFAFHALLSEGYFHALCKNLCGREKETLRTLMLVLSHLFGRYNLPPSVLENRQSRDKSTSVVVLPALPKTAARILRSSNQKTLGIYSAYVKTFVDQHITEADCTLPLTQIKCGGDKPAREISTSPSFLAPTRVTSAFAALSGHRDEWNTIHELCTRIRSGVWLEQSVIPHLQISPEKDGPAPLNAYLYDFYKHANVHALQTENKIRSGDLWFVLNDFSLVLATIVTSLENFMKLTPGMDTDLLDSMGGADASDDELDAGAGSKPVNLPLRGQPDAKAGVAMAKQRKQSKVADSWDDDLSDNSDKKFSTAPGHINHAAESLDEKSKQQFRGPSHDRRSNEADDFLEGEGLLQVLRAFKMLQKEFNDRFRAIWA
ncbi:hypothetical protein ASPCAL09593 [Aspergillus calidoustus]|uniref:DEAD/DEAH box helicase n=1 Tax=Aspergillus calidoustus TaxID=454130 RepID=A0A0U5GTJ1_ASPCI|nr:hypothetical protein ASPCAL09593 [Aspergillus calidoustus]